MHIPVALAIAVLLAGIMPAWASETGQAPAVRAPRAASLDELVLRDGSRLFGTVDRESDDEVVFRTQAGLVLTVPRTEIVSLHRVRGTIVNEEFRRADPNRTRLFFASTGRALERGQVTVGVFEVLIPFVQVGLTDRISVGGGTPLIFGFSDNWNRPFWVTPKVQVLSREQAQVAVGAFHVFDTDGNGGGIAYGVGTFGTDAGAMTVGAGVTYTGFDGEGALLMLGGERQVRRNIKLISENYLWTGGGGVLSLGVRFFGERLAADLGFALPLGSGNGYLFPVVNVVYVF